MMVFLKWYNITKQSKNPIRGIHFYLDFMLTKMLIMIVFKKQKKREDSLRVASFAAPIFFKTA